MKEHMTTNIGQYVIMIKDKKILFLYPRDYHLLNLPGGRLDSDEEDYKEALKREVKEEINIEIDNIEPFDIKMWSIKGKRHRYGVFFLCDFKESEIKLSHEHIDYKWLTFEETIESKSIGEPGKELLRKLRKKGYL